MDSDLTSSPPSPSNSTLQDGASFPAISFQDNIRAQYVLLTEELGIEVTEATEYMRLHHEYPDRTVDLEFFGYEYLDTPLVYVVAACFVLGFLVALVVIFGELKISAHIQSRIGPYFAGGRFGWAQPLADGAKFIQKEDLVPAGADAVVFKTAPYIVVIMVVALLVGWTLMLPANYLPNGNKNLVLGLMYTPPGYSLKQKELVGRRLEVPKHVVP